MSPGATIIPWGRRKSPWPPLFETFTAAVAWPNPVAVAVTVVAPAATPVIGIVMLVVFCGTITEEGAVAAPVLLEETLTVNPPAGAPVERVNVRFCVAVPVTARGEGVSVIVPPPPPLPMIVRFKVAVAVCTGELLSVTRNVSGVKAADDVGVPERTPEAAFRLRPDGSVPPVRDQVRAPFPPTACRDWE